MTSICCGEHGYLYTAACLQQALGHLLNLSGSHLFDHIGKRTVHAMRERGELPYSKLEHKIYFRTDDIIRLMDSHDSCGIPTANIQKISEKIKP